jgi:hypothetical protein
VTFLLVAKGDVIRFQAAYASEEEMAQAALACACAATKERAARSRPPRVETWRKTTMKRLLGISLLAGAVTLAIVVGQRMSTDAMAVMVGVVFGVAASIPTSLLIALAARGSRRSEPPYRRDDYQPSPPAPQIYVVSPGRRPLATAPAQHALPQAPGGYYMAEPARRFKVVGEANTGWMRQITTVGSN